MCVCVCERVDILMHVDFHIFCMLVQVQVERLDMCESYVCGLKIFIHVFYVFCMLVVVQAERLGLCFVCR